MSGTENEIRVMSVMAHQDDFEFTAAGACALMQRRFGARVHLRILAVTRGASGHHRMTPEETFSRRDAEARKSAALLGAEYEFMRGLDGHPLTGQVFLDRNTLGGLWNHIRAFRPDFILCPPVTSDPLAGIHIDHEHTAAAVRLVAYQLCVPHAYPTIGATVSEAILTPLIVNVDDGYSCENRWHVRVDVAPVYAEKLAMAMCHESQIFEWLPFSRGESGPITAESFRAEFAARHVETNRRYGMPDTPPAEYFRITKWGRGATRADLETLFPTGIFQAGCFQDDPKPMP